MSLVSNPKPGDDVSVRQAIARLGSSKLGPTSTPTFLGVTTTSLTISGLTTNSLIYPVAGLLTSLGVATDGQLPIGSTGAAPVIAGLTGTANQVTVTNGAGSITLSTPQDIHTGASNFTVAGATVTGASVVALNSAVFQPAAGGDSTTFFQVLDADGGTPVVNIDTTNERVGIKTNIPLCSLHIKANAPGTVGSHPAGQLIIQDPDDTVFGNAVITGYESDGAGNPDQQLWYLGSSSSSNSDIIYLNRRNSKLHLGTNGIVRMTIESGAGSGYIGIGELSPETLTEWTSTIPYLTLHNSTAEDADNGGESRIIGKRQDGVGTETAAGQIEISHDGSGANDQLGKIVLSVNTGSGLTQALEIGSDLLATFASLDLTGITDGNIPYISASGFADSPLSTDATDVISTGVVQATNFAKTGWPITPGVTLSFDDASKVFTVTDGGSAYYYISGVKYVLGGNKTVDLDDVTPAEGVWYIYFVGSTLTASQTPWVIEDEDKAFVASLYWDNTNNKETLLGYELHSFIMDGKVHQRLHECGGAAWASGLLVADAGSEQVNVSAGEFHDEDIDIEVSDGAGAGLFEQVLSPAELPVYYRSGASDWRIYETTDKANAIDAGYVSGSNELHYNKLNGTWASVYVGAAKYVAYYVIGTNDQTEPIALIMGQAIYSTLAGARDDIFSGLSLSGMPFQEMVVLARLILKQSGSGVYYTLSEVTDLRATNQSGGVTSPLITDHGGLGGLSDDDHAQYLLADGTRALAGAWDMGSQAITNINVDSGDINVAVVNTKWDTAYIHSQVASGNPHSVTPTELSLLIGTNTQAWDAGLDSLAALTYVSDSFIKVTATDTYAIRTIAETKTDLSLNLVENTALSSWVGTTNITTLGTIATGTWEATDVGIAHGGSGQSTAQAAIDALTAVSGATVAHVLTKDGSNNATFQANVDEKIKVDSGATADYLGAASNDGVLRVSSGLSYTDGGNFATLGCNNPVSIGDTTDYDFILTDLTTDGTWRDLDCSGIVPAGTTFIMFKITVIDDAVDSRFELRPNGNSDVYNTNAVRTIIVNGWVDAMFICACDTNRIVEYRAANLTWSGIFINVVSYWTS